MDLIIKRSPRGFLLECADAARMLATRGDDVVAVFPGAGRHAGAVYAECANDGFGRITATLPDLLQAISGKIAAEPVRSRSRSPPRREEAIPDELAELSILHLQMQGSFAAEGLLPSRSPSPLRRGAREPEEEP